MANSDYKIYNRRNLKWMVRCKIKCNSKMK